MADRYIDFMVSATGAAPPTLRGSIQNLRSASRDFCESWLSQDLNAARSTSERAFQLLDHIQNELLRRRDDHKLLSNWLGSPLQQALAARVGVLVEPTTLQAEAAFRGQALGNGVMPNGMPTTPLKLADALNKLKHRSSNAVNFAVSARGHHQLIILTLAGSGRPNSLSSFEVKRFCAACRAAASTL